jgi:tetratricopeptide (TPR) repeat protein
VGESDATMIRIGRGIELSQRGEREAARKLFAQVWSDVGGDDGDPLHRCALAHAMADVQDDVHEELRWDLRALAAADLITDERAAEVGVETPVAGFYPSLHLNLGECYRKLGDLDQAQQHLERGRASVGSLGDDGYGKMIKAGLDRLADRLVSCLRSSPMSLPPSAH